MSWRERADQVIAMVDAALPADADLRARRRALRLAKPWDFAGTSWGRKVWAAAARQYLERYGAGRDEALRGLPLSPLERMQARAERSVRLSEKGRRVGVGESARRSERA